MDFRFDESLAKRYKSTVQRIRVMSEDWVVQNIFCPCCGNPHISKKMPANAPVADFHCDRCGEIFELKSHLRGFGNKIPDGAYGTMIERINGLENPDLFLLNYSDSLEVTDFTVIPKFFFAPRIIEKRNPLGKMAVRAGWVGCNILISKIPVQAHISIISQQRIRIADDVVSQYRRVKLLRTDSMERRGWLFDVLNSVNRITEDEFTLREVYEFSGSLQNANLENHHIEAKIRQQLQVLRDKGFIQFLGRGRYRKITSV